MEGPSLVILSEQLELFHNKKILSSFPEKYAHLKNHKLKFTDSWGKYFFIHVNKSIVRIHFLMFGSYRINEKKAGRIPKLALQFKDSEANFYTCAVREITEAEYLEYDQRVNLMSDKWDLDFVFKKIKKSKDENPGDLLLNQEIFAGAGNIIKNEVLFRNELRPDKAIKNIDDETLKILAEDTRKYSHQFYEWKKDFILKKQWKIYRKTYCPNCHLPVSKVHTGKTERISYFCTNCQH